MSKLTMKSTRGASLSPPIFNKKSLAVQTLSRMRTNSGSCLSSVSKHKSVTKIFSLKH